MMDLMENDNYYKNLKWNHEKRMETYTMYYMYETVKHNLKDPLCYVLLTFTLRLDFTAFKVIIIMIINNCEQTIIINY